MPDESFNMGICLILRTSAQHVRIIFLSGKFRIRKYYREYICVEISILVALFVQPAYLPYIHHRVSHATTKGAKHSLHQNKGDR